MQKLRMEYLEDGSKWFCQKSNAQYACCYSKVCMAVGKMSKKPNCNIHCSHIACNVIIYHFQCNQYRTTQINIKTCYRNFIGYGLDVLWLSNNPIQPDISIAMQLLACLFLTCCIYWTHVEELAPRERRLCVHIQYNTSMFGWNNVSIW